MRVLGVLAGCWCLCIGSLGWAGPAEQQFPYTAFVRTADSQLRSGAGRNFYATHKLPAGQQVEVYKHGSNGWCAVRPPEDSFSWVLSDVLRVDSNGIGIVLKDKSACHVGSGISDLWDVVQVRLDRGEEVEVLDAVLRDRPDDGSSENTSDTKREMWCKIAPPSGEFRWIELASLDREPPAVSSGPVAARSSLLDPAVASDTSLAPRTSILDPPLTASTPGSRFASGPIKTNGWKQSRIPLSRNDDSPRSRIATTAIDSSAVNSTALNEDERGATRPPSNTKLGDKTAGAAEALATLDVGLPQARPEFQEEVDAIDFELSRIVTAEPTNWNFSKVQTQVDVALAKAQSALERGKVRLIQSRIAKFDDIRQRQTGMTAIAASPRDRSTPIRLPASDVAIAAPTAGASANLAAANTPRTLPVDEVTGVAPAAVGVAPETANAALQPAANLTAGADDATKFDGVGKLTKVVSQRPNAPKYALVNASNDVVSFVTPAPGVNLQAFEGQYVGVIGQRGYMPELKKPHVTALRIAPTEAGRLESGTVEIGRTNATKRR